MTARRTTRNPVAALLAGLVILGAAGEAAAAGEAIRLRYKEGDVSGTSAILDPSTREQIGIIEYRQRIRKDGTLYLERTAFYADGSSDGGWAEARAGDRLEALRGEIASRDPDGRIRVEVLIDVVQGRIQGRWRNDDGSLESSDDTGDLPPGTYWGPLIFLVVKNFEANAEDGRLEVHTVQATPKPRAFDLEIVDKGHETIRLFQRGLEVNRRDLQPTLNWAVDPLLQFFTPTNSFFLLKGPPPGLARFDGVRDYRKQRILIE